MPSLLAALAVPGFDNPLGVRDVRAACVLLVDGLGWAQLREHAVDAPFLSSLAEDSEPLVAGFPATTATSLASLATGQPAGVHGIVSYSFALPGIGLLDTLTWTASDDDTQIDLRERVLPEQVQPTVTMLERATHAGVDVTCVVPPRHEHSGLSRAVLRGGDFRAARALGELAAAVLATLAKPHPALCYAYLGDLDGLGHAHGPGSLEWRLHLSTVDHLVSTLAERMPPGSVLTITSDHGMIDVPGDCRVDVDTHPVLREGVRYLAGDVRARHVYTQPGAAADVLAAWQEVLGPRAWVLSRDQATEAGWFGPVTGRVRPRIGDVVTASCGHHGIVRSHAEPNVTAMVAHHGSFAPAEQHVLFLTSYR
ncbi:Type I phosphodiesterase / nucleotide pyrophosphatase [Streptoalloteichus hindustanus]|uniref:Type I phosphodiesterase / nucleotide pyrophosphatase n=2 Tax=Streptoalloteichus hindustanus TaxID=2017 RepID=A0A1M5DBH5_STRHI|nr:Type I phosphodiesterase / nucleotide pyrophosphatase [Streptoalloteichus hindustanus]